jgi:hypothetical protein
LGLLREIGVRSQNVLNWIQLDDYAGNSVKKPKKRATVRLILTEMEREIELLRSRLGAADIANWDDKTRKEQDRDLFAHCPELIRLWRGLAYLQATVGRIGRQKGDRAKLTPDMIRRIKSNGQRNVAALARELGVSRQTIYTILRER